MPRIVVVATIVVRVSATDAFHEFEREAAQIMRSHGGRIERTVTIPPEPGAHTFREVHVITFPFEESWGGYRADPRLAALADLRDSAIVATHVLVGDPGPDYHSAD